MEKRTRFVLSTAFLLPLACCSERKEAYYPTYADAAREGALQRGWLPAFVPASAYEIYEVHDLDTNAQRIRFRVPPSDAPSLTRQMVPRSLPQIHELQSLHRPPSLSIPWPRELEAERETTTSLGLFVASASDKQTLCVAVEWVTGLVHAWTCSRPGE